MLHNTSVRQDLEYCTLFAPSQHQSYNEVLTQADIKDPNDAVQTNS